MRGRVTPEIIEETVSAPKDSMDSKVVSSNGRSRKPKKASESDPSRIKKPKQSKKSPSKKTSAKPKSDSKRDVLNGENSSEGLNVSEVIKSAHRRLMTLGVMTDLLGASPAHKHVFISDFEWLILPALNLDQVRIFSKNEVPLAFATWALVNADVDARLRSGSIRLKPSEWQSGEIAWLVDLVAPYAPNPQPFLNELKRSVFADKPIFCLTPSPETGRLEPKELLLKEPMGETES